MAVRDTDLWHQVHAQREDGVPATFLIRDVEPRADQPQIFVIEMPYRTTDPSKLPDEASFRRLDTFQEQWIEPACEALGWTFVAWKSEDGSFFLYLYGGGDPDALFEKLTPFDGALNFFHERDADWSEYAALRELVEQAEAAPDDEGEDGHVHTDACDHDHDHDYGHDHDHDHDHGHNHASNGIVVIDRTGDHPAAEAKAAQPAATRSRAAKPSPAKVPAAKARKAKARKASARKPAITKSAAAKTRATKAARTRPVKAKPASAKRAASKTAKPATKKPASNQAAARRPAAGKRSTPRTSRR